MQAGKAAIVGVLALALAPGAFALQTTDSFETRINIGTSCSVIVSNLDFGMVGTISSHTASATVQVNCSLGTPYQLSFSNSGSVTSYSGTMTNGTDTIAYSAALSSAGGIGPGIASIMGLVPPQPTPSDGIYTDNRTVYLNY